MWIRVFLFVLAIAWTPYGMYCLAFPEALGALAGVEATSATALTELRAMYGGLQIAVGLSALLGFFRVVYVDKVLFTQLVIVAGLGSGRLAGALLGADLSGYTLGALAFEWLTVLFCIMAMRSQPRSL